jgi:hypothetical protein
MRCTNGVCPALPNYEEPVETPVEEEEEEE